MSLKIFDYIAELDNHYALAMYPRTLECYTEPQIDDSNDWHSIL